MSQSSSLSSSSSSIPLPSLSNTLSSSTTTSSSSTSLTPDAYLARFRANPTSAEKEIWSAAHRLYLYLTLSSSHQTRASCFRRLVRLCIAYPDLLLGSVQTTISSTPLTACPICSTSHTPSTHCCWFLPDQREQNFLNLLVSLCRDHAGLFGDDVTPEQFQASFQWE